MLRTMRHPRANKPLEWAHINLGLVIGETNNGPIGEVEATKELI